MLTAITILAPAHLIKRGNLKESRAFRRLRRNRSAPIDSFDQQRQLSVSLRCRPPGTGGAAGR